MNLKIINKYFGTMQNIGEYSTSIFSIIIANVFVLIGFLFFSWSFTEVLILYWAESAIIGFYVVLKMIYVKDLEKNSTTPIEINKIKITLQNIPLNIQKLFFISFFIFHYGIFMLVHLAFLISFIISFFLSLSLIKIIVLNEIVTDRIITNEFINNLSGLVINIFLGLIVLGISHTISFIVNYLGKKEYKNTNMIQLVISPYKRIIAMHIFIIFGSFLIMFISTLSILEPIFPGSSTIIYTIGVIIIITGKTFFDIIGHVLERKS